MPDNEVELGAMAFSFIGSFLTITLLWSAGAKLWALRRRRIPGAISRLSEHVSPRLRSIFSSRILLLAVAGAELAVTTLIWTTPAFGFSAAAALFCVFIPFAVAAEADEPCGCFGGGTFEFGRSRLTRTIRNIVLAALSAVGLIALPAASVPLATQDGRLGLLTAVSAVLLVLAVEALNGATRALRSHQYVGSAIVIQEVENES